MNTPRPPFWKAGDVFASYPCDKCGRPIGHDGRVSPHTPLEAECADCHGDRVALDLDGPPPLDSDRH